MQTFLAQFKKKQIFLSNFGLRQPFGFPPNLRSHSYANNKSFPQKL